MEYKITTSEIPAQRTDYDKEYSEIEARYTGLLVHIRPPISLNSDAVERYLMRNNLQPIAEEERSHQSNDVNDVVVLGSTAVQTTIYASISKLYPDAMQERVTGDVAQLLRFMGAQAIVE